jgi:hypothetical protein
MFDVSSRFAGTVTVACLVGLGIFIYPWLLGRGGGIVTVGVMTALLAGLFYLFDRGSSAAAGTSVLLAFLWALGPLIAGAIVRRSQRATPPG